MQWHILNQQKSAAQLNQVPHAAFGPSPPYNLGKKGLLAFTPLEIMILTAAGGGCPGAKTTLSIIGQLVPWFKKTLVSA